MSFTNSPIFLDKLGAALILVAASTKVPGGRDCAFPHFVTNRNNAFLLFEIRNFLGAFCVGAATLSIALIVCLEGN